MGAVNKINKEDIVNDFGSILLNLEKLENTDITRQIDAYVNSIAVMLEDGVIND